MNVKIFKDQSFKIMPEYHADDLAQLFLSENIAYSLIDHAGLEKLNRLECDVLVIPYIDGEFSPKALQSLLDFHSDGGSLFFLGDLPHRERWYPIRNMRAFDFHLTRCYDDISISADKPEIRGLTAKGQEILGQLEDFDFIKGRNIPALRITAFPPDEAYPLLAIHSHSHANVSSAVMVTERKCQKFLGAKFAIIGFNGGEPRENVAGVYEREWTYDSGLLTREWKGINPMVLKLLDWLEPEPVAGAIDADSVADAGKFNKLTVNIRNLTDKSQKIDRIILKKDGNVIFEQGINLAARETANFAISTEKADFGIYQYELTADTKILSTFTERILPEYPDIYNVSKGYGFSTYWSFQEPKITEEFKFFCHEMKRRGCSYLRANIPWEDVEPEPGVYNWSIPDQMLDFAAAEGITLQFWMFPTTRASGLGDAGVPEWSLKEPAIDRYGNSGFFPSLWSPFYRKHYFGMLTEFTKRYADNPNLSRFILDFGNSDFPYGYYYYVNDTTLFDYSEHERKAFANYLKNEIVWSLDKVNQLYAAKFADFNEVPVPYAEQIEPYRVYLDFRTWSIRQGINTVHEIIRTNAPDKLPPDLPGHGLGSIADISTAFYEVKKRHWLEEKKFVTKYTEMHNAGPVWGGEKPGRSAGLTGNMMTPFSAPCAITLPITRFPEPTWGFTVMTSPGWDSSGKALWVQNGSCPNWRYSTASPGMTTVPWLTSGYGWISLSI